MKLLRQLIFIIVLSIAALGAKAALTGSAPAFAPGSQELVAIDLDAQATDVAAQFTVAIPEGFTLASTSSGIELGERAEGHEFRINKVDGKNAYKCVIYSTANTPFAAGNAPLFSLKLKAANSVTKGTYWLEFSDVRLSDAQGNETAVEDTSIDIEVYIPATNVTVEPAQLSIRLGETGRVAATVTPAESSQRVSWTSRDESIATVDADGNITAVGIGSTSVTATTADGTNLSASCAVTVTPPLATSLTLNSTQAEVRVGESISLTATVQPADAEQAVAWSSSNEAVATVDASGKVTCVADGKATITATTADGTGLTASCEVTVKSKLAMSISLDLTELGLHLGESRTLTATVLPDYALNRSATWASSNPAVATVDADGRVTAVALGEATVTATTADGSNLSASCHVTVTNADATSVEISQEQAELRVRETMRLTATVLPANAAQGVNWSSSNPAVAKVDGEGLVTAVARGVATITATTADGSNLSASCEVTVIPALATGVTLSATEAEVRVGESMTLTARVQPADAEQAVAWSSSNEAVATVDASGNVTGVADGKATITATTADGTGLTASCEVTVKSKLAMSISLDLSELGLHLGESRTLTATVLPEYALNRSVTWASSNPTVATVDADGRVTAMALGEATVTATTADGSALSASCHVTVTNADATSVEISQEQAELRVRETLRLTATVLPANAAQGVNWSSSNPAVATVDGEGLVTAVARGVATITATTADGSNLSASCEVTVIPALATGVTLSATEAEVRVGESMTLTATVQPAEAEQAVTWSSSNEAVATVDASGKVTGIALGEATITATTTDGTELSASCSVTVTFSLIREILINPDHLTIEEGKTEVVTATILPATANPEAVVWESNHPEIATVDAEGLVTAIAEGEAVITLSATDGSWVQATCHVTVEPDAGIHDVELAGVKVAVEGGRIRIIGDTDRRTTRVYNIEGREIQLDSDMTTSPLVRGIYIVRIGAHSLKVTL